MSYQSVIDRIVADFAPKPAPASPLVPEGIPLFELTAEVIKAITGRDRDQLLRDCKAADALHLPFPSGIALRFPADDLSDIFQMPDMGKSAQYYTAFFSGDVTLDTTTCRPFYATVKQMKEFRRTGIPILSDQVSTPILDRVQADASMSFYMVNEYNGGATGYMAERIERKHWRTLIDISEYAVARDGVPAEYPGYVSTKHGTINEFEVVCREALGILLVALWAKDTVKRPAGREWSRRNDERQEAAIRENTPVIISRTRIELPETVENDPDHPPIGRMVTPHLRRGHPHTVVHGKGRLLRKVQWFAPTWVGVDPDYAASRRYVVRS